jgi:mRNA interferase RelE/StbE
VSETARRQLGSLPLDMQAKVKRKLRKLEEDPYQPRSKVDIKKLKGPKKDYYRLRIGNYRAIYVIEGNKVMVAKILPRSKLMIG